MNDCSVEPPATIPPVRIVVAGLGSIGSRVAESLVRTSTASDAGFRLERVTIFDRDVLELGNLVRHEGLPIEVGLRKVDMIAGRVAMLARRLPIDRLHGCIFDASVAERLEAAVEGSDLVVASFDDPAALFRLNELCIRHARPMLVAEVISGGIGVWLLVANGSPRGPCLVCLAHARGEDVRVDMAPRGPANYADPEATVREARVPADDWTCALAASLLTGVALDAARRGGSPDASLPALRLVALRRVDAPADVAPFFRAPLQTTAVDVPKRSSCPTCSSASVIDEVHAHNLAFFSPEGQ